MRRALTALIAAGMIVSACGGGNPVSTPEYKAYRDQATACGAKKPSSAQVMEFTEPDDLGLTNTVGVTLHTSCGDIVFELYPDLAPATVNSFVFLAEQGYFDGTVSHRIVPGAIIQMGDPTASGLGGPGYTVPDELPAADFVYDTGVLAMANAGPNTSGSQFFIVTGTTALPNNYSYFGMVTSGYETLSAIEAVPLAQRPGSFEVSVPLQTVYIDSVTVER